MTKEPKKIPVIVEVFGSGIAALDQISIIPGVSVDRGKCGVVIMANAAYDLKNFFFPVEIDSRERIQELLRSSVGVRAVWTQRNIRVGTEDNE